MIYIIKFIATIFNLYYLFFFCFSSKQGLTQPKSCIFLPMTSDLRKGIISSYKSYFSSIFPLAALQQPDYHTKTNTPYRVAGFSSVSCCVRNPFSQSPRFLLLSSAQKVTELYSSQHQEGFKLYFNFYIQHYHFRTIFSFSLFYFFFLHRLPQD